MREIPSVQPHQQKYLCVKLEVIGSKDQDFCSGAIKSVRRQIDGVWLALKPSSFPVTVGCWFRRPGRSVTNWGVV